MELDTRKDTVMLGTRIQDIELDSCQISFEENYWIRRRTHVILLGSSFVSKSVQRKISIGHREVREVRETQLRHLHRTSISSLAWTLMHLITKAKNDQRVHLYSIS